MKPVFEEPIVEIIELKDQDIVCASGCGGAFGYELPEQQI